MKTILITGGAGFIGSHLVTAALETGCTLKVLDNLSPQIHGPSATYKARAGVEFLHGDVTNRHDLERAIKGADAIIHLAAETGTGQSMYEIERYYGVNVQGTALMFDILANTNHGVRKIVLASSRSVYGEGAYRCTTCPPESGRCFPKPRSPEQLAAHSWEPRCPACNGIVEPVATKEEDSLAPASIYAASKLAQEDLMRVSCTSLDIPYAILRFQNVFGEGQSLNNPYTGILSIFSTRIRLGLSLPIFEDGQETRDFVHVEDVVNAILRSTFNDAVTSETANVGLGQSTTILSIATMLSRLMNSTIEPHITAQYRVGDIRHNHADISRLRHLIGYEPRISVEEGMKRFCDWVSTQPIPENLLEKANAELKARNLMG